MNENMKHVEFWNYCEKCEHRDKDQWEDPCDECLNYPAREYSHRPLNFKERVSKEKCNC